MSAHIPTRSHTTAPGRVDIKLPWWAVVLPAIAFAILLLLITAPGQAQAASGDPALTHLLERVQESLSR
ncbi:hypothetical protein [Streptomyces beijiangensis]|uniref:Uncharacterized protein n=1 Tax=Streptomyces beijiangensis TaxID=163361 RepID=A0A939JK27_9ACTN|nr:hypothetical protein [Streptomyces beijiangensis]MBO0515372.1 hypothetical protein [Streptomyces beijiangensis]